MSARIRTAILVLGAALLVPGPALGAAKGKPKAFASCAALGKYARKHALKIAGPQGIPFRFGLPVVADLPTTRGPMAPQAEGAPDSGLQEGTDFSGTNNQEQGVDEPDVVKTDGRRLFVAANGALHVFDVSDGTPRLEGSLALRGYGHELLVSGDRVLALTTYYDDPVLSPQPESGREFGPDDRIAAPYYFPEPATRLFEIDVSDPAAPRLLNTLTVEGFYTSARLVGSSARVVVSTPPDPIQVADEDAIRADARLSTWLPDGVLRDRVRRKRSRERMVGCRDVRRPRRYAGPGMLTLLTLDLDKGLEPVDSDSLMTDAQTVYASKRSLFVAAQRWFDPERSREVGEGSFTTVHRFDTSDPGSAAYRASGQVRGFVLNQFSLSEHNGHLRVATTEQPPWRQGAEQRESESFVTVLEEHGRVLGEVGRVGGLGKGERIFAVRFLGDKGYVVTFRQVDPLYTLDLSDPADPRVRGELKILGFSSYLHPIGADLLLGIGQDADEGGRQRGAQVSLFDVSDLSAPARLHAQPLGQYASSAAEYDHRAFLYWPPEKLAVLPLNDYGSEEDQFSGAVGLAIDRDAGISEVGRLQHEPFEDQFGYRYVPPITRSLVANGRLFTVSDAGVLASTLDGLEPVAFAAFASG